MLQSLRCNPGAFPLSFPLLICYQETDLSRSEAELRWSRGQCPQAAVTSDTEKRVGGMGTFRPMPRAPLHLPFFTIFYWNHHIVFQHFIYLYVLLPHIPWTLRWATEICDREQSFSIFVFVPAPRVHSVKWMHAWINPRGTEWMGTHKLGQTQGHCKPPGAFDITKGGEQWTVLPCCTISERDSWMWSRWGSGVLWREAGRVTTIPTSLNLYAILLVSR